MSEQTLNKLSKGSGKGAPRISLLVFIVDWSRQKKTMQALEAEDVAVRLLAKGRGTAGREILDLLGVGSPDKAVFFALEEESRIQSLLLAAAEKAGLLERGVGVAFSLPLSGINTPALDLWTGRQVKESESAEEEIVENNKQHDLVLSILNQGYSDDFMAEARKAGAGGGTILPARGIAEKGSNVKFFGISVQDEKEIIMVLTTRAKRNAIISAVSEKFGKQTEAEGIILSLPADNITGINLS